MADTFTITLDDDIEITMGIGHVTASVKRCRKCGQIYTDDPFFFGQCPYCRYKKENEE